MVAFRFVRMHSVLLRVFFVELGSEQLSTVVTCAAPRRIGTQSCTETRVVVTPVSNSRVHTGMFSREACVSECVVRFE